jgi:hypothetical protein
MPEGGERNAALQTLDALQRRVATFSRIDVVLLTAHAL